LQLSIKTRKNQDFLNENLTFYYTKIEKISKKFDFSGKTLIYRTTTKLDFV